MSEIRLDGESRALAVAALREWLDVELDRQIGDFQAELLVDFAAETLGSLWYNRGLMDARAAFERRVEEIGETIHELERPLPFERDRTRRGR